MPDGDAYLDFMGLADHPDHDRLTAEINEAMAEAADQRLSELITEQRSVRAMLHPEYQAWALIHVPSHHLRPGYVAFNISDGAWPAPYISSWVVVEVSEGWVRLEGEAPYRGKTHNASISCGEWDRQEKRIHVPVPIDATVLADDPIPWEQ